MADNIDGTPAADQAGTGAAPDTTPTTPASDTAGRNAEDRIKGLVAETARHKARADKAEADSAALAEKHKTEDEKRIDELVSQRVESKYGKDIQRLERTEAVLATKRDKLLEAMPEESRACFDDTAPLYVQVQQIELVTSHLSDKASAPAPPTTVDSGGNPPTGEPMRMPTEAEFNEWQQMPSKGKLEEYHKLKPIMHAALDAEKKARDK